MCKIMRWRQDESGNVWYIGNPTFPNALSIFIFQGTYPDGMMADVKILKECENRDTTHALSCGELYKLQFVLPRQPDASVRVEFYVGISSELWKPILRHIACEMKKMEAFKAACTPEEKECWNDNYTY